MSIIFIDGFDHYTTATAMAYKWDAVTTSYVLPNTAGRRTESLAVSTGNSSGYVRKNFGASLATVTIGFAFMTETIPTAERAFATLYDSVSGAQLSFSITPTGYISAFRDTVAIGTRLATSTETISPMVWNFIEIKVYVADSSGTVEVRKNGAAILTFTGDTKQTTNANVASVQFGGATSGSPIVRLDDLYICDANGSVNTTFLGDVRVDTLYPTGAGATTQFTPTGSSNNWENVDDASPDADSTYNSSDTAGNKDTFAFGNLSMASATIYGIQTNLCARKDDAGARTMTDVVRVSSTDYTGATTHSLTTGYMNYRTVREVNPNTTNAWSVSEVNGAEFGYTVTA